MDYCNSLLTGTGEQLQYIYMQSCKVLLPSTIKVSVISPWTFPPNPKHKPNPNSNPNTNPTNPNLNRTDPTQTLLTPVLTLTVTVQSREECPRGNCLMGNCPFPDNNDFNVVAHNPT